MNESAPVEKTPTQRAAEGPDYQKTLNLPQTDFSMKADLTRKEPIIRSQWEKLNLYQEILKKNHGKTKYILHDGPPYANGNVHIGTALNKILKDIVVKFKTMQGFYSPYIPGWDCHGLPIEHKVLTELGPKAKTASQTQIRLHCETVLAEAELEYSNETSPSIYVKFPLTDAQAKELSSKFPSSLDISHSTVSFFIWTTTPWTLPANVSVALNPAFEYALVSTGSDALIMAAGLVEKVMALIGVTDYKILGQVKGTQLEGLTYNHPFVKRTCQVILADYVSLEDGTGIVHNATGHGIE